MARDLLGKLLVYDGPRGRRVVRIVEAEAYLGERDPASHAFRGMTARTAPMFGRAGHSYVYLSHGLYPCMNVVCEGPGIAGAVLLRGAEPVEGVTDDSLAVSDRFGELSPEHNELRFCRRLPLDSACA